MNYHHLSNRKYIPIWLNLCFSLLYHNFYHCQIYFGFLNWKLKVVIGIELDLNGYKQTIFASFVENDNFLLNFTNKIK